MKSVSWRHFQAALMVQKVEFMRDKGGIFLNFVFPLFFAISLVVTNYTSTSFTLDIGVVDPFHNEQAQPFVEALTANIGIEARSVEQLEAEKQLQEGTLHAVVVLPEHSFIEGGDKVELIATPRYQEFLKLVMEAVQARLISEHQRSSEGMLQFDVTEPDTQIRSEFSFTYPGILALALLQLGLFGTAVPLLQAKERGTLKYLLLTPLTSLELLCAQLFIRFVVALLQVSLLLAVGMFILDLSISDWLSIVGVACLGIVMLISIGYAIAGTATNLQVGMAIVLVSNFTMAFLGNIFWDPSSSDLTLYLSYIIPLTYLADMFRQVVTGMAGLQPLWVDALAIVLFSAVAIGFAGRTFKFDNKYKSG